MRRIFLRTLIATGLAFGVIFSTPSATAPAPEPDEVTNEQMVSFYEQGTIGKSVWVVDSRPVGKFISGHIPGSLSLPLDVLKKDDTSFRLPDPHAQIHPINGIIFGM